MLLFKYTIDDIWGITKYCLKLLSVSLPDDWICKKKYNIWRGFSSFVFFHANELSVQCFINGCGWLYIVRIYCNILARPLSPRVPRRRPSSQTIRSALLIIVLWKRYHEDVLFRCLWYYMCIYLITKYSRTPYRI